MLFWGCSLCQLFSYFDSTAWEPPSVSPVQEHKNLESGSVAMFAIIVKCLKGENAALFNTGRCEEEQQENLLVSKLLLEAAREAAKFEAILRSSERNLSEDKQDEALFHYTRFLSQYGKCTQDLTPKCHLMFHQLLEVDRKGNPRFYHSYNDESFNGLIAKMARSCHRSCWAEMIFSKLEMYRSISRKRQRLA